MKIKSPNELYSMIEEALGQHGEPMTCTLLMEQTEVRDAARKRFGDDLQIATNKLSDMLGFMWRRGILTRYTAPDTGSKVRFAYGLPGKREPSPVIALPPPVRHIGNKPRFTITETDEGVVLEFEKITILIK